MLKADRLIAALRKEIIGVMASSADLKSDDPDLFQKYADIQEEEQKRIDQKEPEICPCCGQEIN